MTPETFCEQFATFAEAPNGVAKLRELILQLAVQGKLVPQDVNDEPASLLFEQIVEYRKSTTSRVASIGLLTSGEVGFPLPSGWIAARFGDLVVNRDGERVPVSREIREGRKGPYDYYGASGVIDGIDEFLFDKPLLLIGEDGANLINRSTPIAFIAQGKYWVNNHAHVLDGISLDFLRYIELHINAIDLKPFVTGTAQPKMNQAKMNSIPIALPPLAEQRRIVGKVDQLLGLCDELAARQAARREARSALVEATLDRLVSCSREGDTNREGDAPAEPCVVSESRSLIAARREPRPPGGPEFPAHAHRLRDHFDRLFDTPTTLPQLRQAILQLAIQGQLVPQDPNDETASALLERARMECFDATDDGETIDEAVDSTNESNDFRLTLPPSWKLVRFADIISYGPRNGISPKPVQHVTKTKSLTLSATTSGTFDGRHVKYLPEESPDDSYLWLKDGDILIQRSNSEQYVGVAAIYRGNPNDFVYPDLMMKVRVASCIDIHFAHLILMSPSSRAYFRTRATGTSGSMRKINKATVKSLPFPLPPLAEQKRIVSKVTELLSLCDALEAKLTQAESASTQLLSAAVAHLLQEC